MQFHTRKWVKPEDLNPNGTLFGGRLLAWVDEEAALFAILELDNSKVVTKSMSEMDFKSSAKEGDIVEIGLEIVKFGFTYIDMKCAVRNKRSGATIITIEHIRMACLDEAGKPKPHGKTLEQYQSRFND